ncbi:MAG: response regulator [bacterium]|jgi:DNA-binding response OmpR family regulator|nr:response regulator [candidate division KSB1 bacterium]MDH7560697.1 response regulator [bacterium]
MVQERKKILLVDQDPQGMQPLKALLLQRGCRVGQVDSAEKVLQLCAREVPDTVITGLQLPKMSGEELLRELRNDEHTCAVPVIIIAEQRLLDDRVRIIELGPDEFVPKPYIAQEVVARLEVLLNEIHAAPPLPGPEDMEKGFSGSLAEMSSVDLLEIFHAAGRSGVLHLRKNGQRGAIYVRNGEVVDATVGQRLGEAALAALLLWNEGTFLVDFAAVQRAQRVLTPTRELLAMALARSEEWNNAIAALPSLHMPVQNSGDSGESLDETSRALLARFSTPCPIATVLDESAEDPLALARRLRDLWEKGLLRLCEQDEAQASISHPPLLSRPHSAAFGSPLAAVAELFGSSAVTYPETASATNHIAGHRLTRAELLVTRARLA